MKRVLIVILLCTAVLMYGCRNDSQTHSKTVNFFYLSADADSEDKIPASVITSEKFDAGERLSDIDYLLERYLEGPSKKGSKSPFPSQLRICSLTIQNNTAYVILSEQIGQLDGIDLTLACSCLTLTVLDLTQTNSVQITAENALLNGSESLTMDAGCIMLIDNYQ